MSRQLPLSMHLRPDATFSGFVSGPNEQAVSWLRDRIGELRSLYLWGGSGTGKTHLLQAGCHAAASRGEGAVYLPLRQAHRFSTDILDGLESLALICVDDIDRIAGLDSWEQALFHLYNRVRDNGRTIVVTGDQPAGSLGLRLPDLLTRLGWDLAFQLHPLDDAALGQALRLRARSLGIELPEEVAAYLLHRCVRDSNTLFDLLERLDRASLSAQRRLTIPFVKECLEDPNDQPLRGPAD